MRLAEADFLTKTQDMIDLLSDPKCLAQYKESKNATDMSRKVLSCIEKNIRPIIVSIPLYHSIKMFGDI